MYIALKKPFRGKIFGPAHEKVIQLFDEEAVFVQSICPVWYLSMHPPLYIFHLFMLVQVIANFKLNLFHNSVCGHMCYYVF